MFLIILVMFSHDFWGFSPDLVMIFGNLVTFSPDLGVKYEKTYIETSVIYIETKHITSLVIVPDPVVNDPCGHPHSQENETHHIS